MATATKFQIFCEDLAKGEHVIVAGGGDTLMLALSNAANPPSVSADAVLADITCISLTNLTDATPNVTVSSSAQSSGTYTLKITDYVFTATGAVGPFQYVILYNSTATSKTNPLIVYVDYGSEITLGAGDTFTVNFDDAAGVLTIA